MIVIDGEGHELFEPGAIPADGEALACGAEMNIEPVLGPSIPTNKDAGDASMTLACEYGLALRPKRLFGFSEHKADGAPNSATGSITLPCRGLPSAN